MGESMMAEGGEIELELELVKDGEEGGGRRYIAALGRYSGRVKNVPSMRGRVGERDR